MHLFYIIALFLCTNVLAQEKPAYGFADDYIPELAQFEYYRGVWKSEMEMKQDDGTFKKLDAVATIRGKFLDDHKTFQSQFTTDRGFFSTDIRTFNTTTKEWNALFLNAKSQRWHEFTSEIIDGKMTTIVKGGYSGKEEFDVKIIDTVISDSHFLKNVYQSRDEMKTWDLTYKINVKKIE
jgi:hypothetical protein